MALDKINPKLISRQIGVQKRNTVMAGPSTWMTAGTDSVNVANVTSSDPLVLTFANGFDSAGAIDYGVVVDTTVSNAWTGLTVDDTYYLYIDYNEATGAITYGHTTTQPKFQDSADASSGQYVYRSDLYKSFVGNGATSDPVIRVFVGEVVRSGTVGTPSEYVRNCGFDGSLVAFVNFDGTRDDTGAASTANTNRFIRASKNVSSVLRNGTGDYTINFENAMPDADYAIYLSSDRDGGTSAGSKNYSSITTSAYNIDTFDSATMRYDHLNVSSGVFR